MKQGRHVSLAFPADAVWEGEVTDFRSGTLGFVVAGGDEQPVQSGGEASADPTNSHSLRQR